MLYVICLGFPRKAQYREYITAMINGAVRMIPNPHRMTPAQEIRIPKSVVPKNVP
ncbi:hypothetical protein [Chryseobacterium wanjuense]